MIAAFWRAGGEVLDCRRLQGLVYKFESLSELAQALNASGADQELGMPCHHGVRDGEWLLITFSIGDEATCAAGRVADRDGDLKLVFEQRDWERLVGFANGRGSPSIPPLSHPSSVPEAISAPPGATALLVDDDPCILSIVRTVLSACGVNTQIAQGADEALDLLRRGSFDVMVVEPAVDGMSGLDLCRLVRAERGFTASVPILLLTSECCRRDVSEALGCGADDFIAKPFRAHELRARVLGLLQRVRTQDLSEQRV